MNKKGNQNDKNLFMVIGLILIITIFFYLTSQYGLFSIFNTNFITNIDNEFNKEIPVYQPGEIINMKHTIDLDNPRGRNNGGYQQYGLIFYYVDDMYIGGSEFGVGNNGNPRVSQSTITSQNFIIGDLSTGEHEFKSVFYVAQGGNSCSSGSSVSCGQRIEPQTNCLTGQTFTSNERYSDAVFNFIRQIPCEYKSGTSATDVLFPAGDDWSDTFVIDGYKKAFVNKFEVENPSVPQIVLNWWQKFILWIKSLFN